MADPGERALTAEEERRLRDVPKGAATVAGVAVALMLAAWFLIWLLIYLPRGPIG